MEFYNRSNYPKSEGQKFSTTKPVYKLVINKKGQEELKQIGEADVIEPIQQYKDECDIYKILERYERGDINAINKISGTYGDFRNMPSTLVEAQNMIKQAEQNFNSLPTELKKEFNNNYNEFIAKMTDGSAKEIFEKYNNEKFGKKDEPKAENNNVTQNSNGNENNQGNQNGGIIYE